MKYLLLLTLLVSCSAKKNYTVLINKKDNLSGNIIHQQDVIKAISDSDAYKQAAMTFNTSDMVSSLTPETNTSTYPINFEVRNDKGENIKLLLPDNLTKRLDTMGQSYLLQRKKELLNR